ncbi:MAG: hypothetical protein NTW86_16645 [Candidatus Sumerlaeota bacterium]|nr:hypothetical protein [Candidatus Sumerlaeota bacterium]
MAAAQGDRHPAPDCVLPAEALMHAGKGKRVIDATKSILDAKEDGIADDAAALFKAHDYSVSCFSGVVLRPWN